MLRVPQARAAAGQEPSGRVTLAVRSREAPPTALVPEQPPEGIPERPSWLVAGARAVARDGLAELGHSHRQGLNEGFAELGRSNLSGATVLALALVVSAIIISRR